MSWFSRLFRRRGRSAGGDTSMATYRPGSWAEVALPPRVQIVPAPVADQSVVASPSPIASDQPANAAPAEPAIPGAASPSDPATTDDVPSPRAKPLIDEPVLVRSSVRLGFVDGTTVDFDEESGEFHELRRVAARLIDDPR